MMHTRVRVKNVRILFYETLCRSQWQASQRMPLHMHACMHIQKHGWKDNQKNIVSGSIYWMSRDIKTVSEYGLAYKDTGSIPCI